jgi:hypothetical protein
VEKALGGAEDTAKMQIPDLYMATTGFLDRFGIAERPRWAQRSAIPRGKVACKGWSIPMDKLVVSFSERLAD